MANEAFFPISHTFSLDVLTTSATISPVISPVPPRADIETGGYEYRFTNIGTQPVFVANSPPGAGVPVAVYPTTGGNQHGVLILPGSVITLKFVYGTQLAVIAAATGSTIHVCIGRGVVA